MKQVGWKKLSVEGFATYGMYADMMSPAGPKIGAEPIEFYRDMVQSHLGVATVASFGVCRVVKRPFIRTFRNTMTAAARSSCPWRGTS